MMLATSRRSSVAAVARRLEPGASGGTALVPGGSAPLGAEGVGASHLCVDRSSRFVLTANYGVGTISLLPIDPADGSLGPATEYSHGEGAAHGAVGTWREGPKFRQEQCHPHGVVCDPINNAVFVADLGSNCVVRWALDADAAALHSPTSYAVENSFAGPRCT